MSTKTAKWIFYAGTLSSALLFLILTFDTHRQVAALTHADRLSDEVVAGKHVFQKYNCNDCHTILGFGGYYAPDLTRVYSRRGEKYIRGIITQPELTLANSFRKMPHQNVSPEEIDKLLAFFQWVDGIDNNNWPPQDEKSRRSSETARLMGGTDLSPGAALFKSNNCITCHKIGGVGGDAGPALDAIGSRLDRTAIRKQITDPQSLRANSDMPAYPDLSAGDLKALVDFLVKQKGDN
ncbi:Cytochrome c class I [Candidatus Zixiibacteriota bacterium]|nr:Cytochrome c class I [candidate division Zixibacteria bacterium]